MSREKQPWPAWRERNSLQRALPEEGPALPGDRAVVFTVHIAGVLDALNQADWKEKARRAEVRGLRSALRRIMREGSGPGFTEYDIAEAALKTRRSE